MQPVLFEHDISLVEAMIEQPTPLNDVIARVGRELRHIDDPTCFTRSVLARLSQGSRASVNFNNGVPIWTRIKPPEREQ